MDERAKIAHHATAVHWDDTNRAHLDRHARRLYQQLHQYGRLVSAQRGIRRAPRQSLSPLRLCHSVVRKQPARELAGLRGSVQGLQNIRELEISSRGSPNQFVVAVFTFSGASRWGEPAFVRLPWAGLPLIACLVPVTLIDLDYLWLPEPLFRCGLTLSLLISCSGGLTLLSPHLIAAVLGLLALEVISALGERMLGQPALGLGDAKLAALGGAWLGSAGLSVAFGLAVLSGALVGSAGRLTGHLGPSQPFAFGPLRTLGIWLVWLQGPTRWWARWLDLTSQLL